MGLRHASVLIAACAIAIGSAGLAGSERARPTDRKTLDFYFIDVEGGQSTLIVTPAGQSMLVDAGYGGFDGRDPARVMAAANDAGLAQIDYLVTTHFHGDMWAGCR